MPHSPTRCSGNSRHRDRSHDSHDKPRKHHKRSSSRSGKRRKHKHSSSHSGKRKKRHHKRKHSSSRSREERCERSCGSATLSFDVIDLNNQDKCIKYYLFIDSSAITPIDNGVKVDPSVPITPAEAAKIESTVPIDAESLVVTWDFVRDPAVLHPDPDVTRYIITVDRVNGSCFSPVVKFQVPISHTPINDCGGLSQESQLMGTSQPFRVKLCAGDELCVGITRTIGENCVPGQCGALPTPAETPQTTITPLKSAIVKLYLF